MKTYVCRVCHHVKFDEAPVNCPVCEAPIENFERDDNAIKRPSAPDCLTEFEKKHLPMLEIKKGCSLAGGNCIDVLVRIGEIEHEMESEHYISFIDFYIDKRYISRTILTPKSLHPATVLHLNVDGGRLIVIENCSIHGYWMTEKEILIIRS